MATTPPAGWSKTAWTALGLVRLVLGLIFLWAFLDMLLGLGYSTPAASSWLHGGHPTKGYLSSSFGPLASIFKSMAGTPVVDALFMAGLGGVGLCLTLGVATRLGSWSGFAMVLLMYASHPVPWMKPHGSHPFIDDHVLEAACFLLLATTACGMALGLGRWWQSRPFVARNPWLH